MQGFPPDVMRCRPDAGRPRDRFLICRERAATPLLVGAQESLCALDWRQSRQSGLGKCGTCGAHQCGLGLPRQAVPVVKHAKAYSVPSQVLRLEVRVPEHAGKVRCQKPRTGPFGCTACTTRASTLTARVSGRGQGKPRAARAACASTQGTARLSAGRALTTTSASSVRRRPITKDIWSNRKRTRTGSLPMLSRHHRDNQYGKSVATTNPVLAGRRSGIGRADPGRQLADL